MSDTVEKLVHLVSPGETRYFTLCEANSVLPAIKAITSESYKQLDLVRRELANLLPNDPRLKKVEAQYEEIVRKWVSKMERFGVTVKGLWLLDFDTGDGYLCWKYPELKVSHFHEYTGGFATREPVEEVIEQIRPDWA